MEQDLQAVAAVLVVVVVWVAAVAAEPEWALVRKERVCAPIVGILFPTRLVRHAIPLHAPNVARK